MARAKSPASASSTATIGFKARQPLRKDLTADKLRNNRDAAVTERSDQRRQQPEPSKHGVLGLAYLKYISCPAEENRLRLLARLRAQLSSLDSVIQFFRITADDGNPTKPTTSSPTRLSTFST